METHTQRREGGTWSQVQWNVTIVRRATQRQEFSLQNRSDKRTSEVSLRENRGRNVWNSKHGKISMSLISSIAYKNGYDFTELFLGKFPSIVQVTLSKIYIYFENTSKHLTAFFVLHSWTQFTFFAQHNHHNRVLLQPFLSIPSVLCRATVPLWAARGARSLPAAVNGLLSVCLPELTEMPLCCTVFFSLFAPRCVYLHWVQVKCMLDEREGKKKNPVLHPSFHLSVLFVSSSVFLQSEERRWRTERLLGSPWNFKEVQWMLYH